MANASAPFPPIPTDELDRKLRWRVLPVLGFIGLMLGLGTVAALSWLAPAHRAEGLPDDRDARVAGARLAALAWPAPGTLAFRSALTGDAPIDPLAAPADSATSAALADADAALARAARRHRFDARVAAASGHVALLRARPALAVRRYEWALALPGYSGEAHLGYGVALAALADRADSDEDRRQLWLRAVAQFAAVREDDPLVTLAQADLTVARDQARRAR